MNKWLALLLIVIAVILDKHIGALISLKKLKSEEKIAEDNRRTAEMEERQAEHNKIEAEAKQLTALMVSARTESKRMADCQKCRLRKYIAEAYDLHWTGKEDCPCICPEKEKKPKKKKEKE